MPPDQPSPESIKLNESLVLVEFIGDLFPESGILPKDPVKRAKARLFIDAISNKFAPAQMGVLVNGGDPEKLIQAAEALQAFLPSQGFVVGEFSFADIAIAPFFARLELNLSNDLGGYPEGQGYGQKVLEALRAPGLTRFQQYWKEVLARPSVSSTFDKVRQIWTSSVGPADRVLRIPFWSLPRGGLLSYVPRNRPRENMTKNLAVVGCDQSHHTGPMYIYCLTY